MKRWLYYGIFLFLSSVVQAEEIIYFEEPPTAKELLESFGYPVVRTRGWGGGISRKVVLKNLTDIPEAAAVTTTERQEHAPTSGAQPKKYHKSVAFSLTFHSGSAVLSKEAQRYVDSMAAALTQRPDLILHISGHTDMAGGDSINIPLSLKRAESVKNYLMEHNIDGSRLKTSGEGSLFPLDLKDSYAAVNRRVQFDKIIKGN